MGIQKDTEFIGRIANLIYYNWLGVFSVRSMPAHVRQNDATKKAAKDFGLISSRSKIIREYLTPHLLDARNKLMQVEFKKALRQKLVSLRNTLENPSGEPALRGFCFNEAFKIEQCLQFPLNVNQLTNSAIRIDIPAINPLQNIMAPPGTTRVEIQAIALSFSFDHAKSACDMAEVLSIPYMDAAHSADTITLELSGKTDGLVLVLLTLNYWNSKGKIKKAGYSPLEIIEVFTQV